MSLQAALIEHGSPTLAGLKPASLFRFQPEEGVDFTAQFLACRKEGKVNRYTAQVSKESYQRRESRSLLERFYHRSLKHLAAALYDGGDLSQGEIRELQEYLSELEKKKGE